MQRPIHQASSSQQSDDDDGYLWTGIIWQEQQRRRRSEDQMEPKEEKKEEKINNSPACWEEPHETDREISLLAFLSRHLCLWQPIESETDREREMVEVEQEGTLRKLKFVRHLVPFREDGGWILIYDSTWCRCCRCWAAFGRFSERRNGAFGRLTMEGWKDRIGGKVKEADLILTDGWALTRWGEASAQRRGLRRGLSNSAPVRLSSFQSKHSAAFLSIQISSAVIRGILFHSPGLISSSLSLSSSRGVKSPFLLLLLLLLLVIDLGAGNWIWHC